MTETCSTAAALGERGCRWRQGMIEEPRRERTPLAAYEVQLMLLLVIGGTVAGIVIGLLTYTAYPEISKLFWTAAVTLLFGSILGGVITLLFADFDRRRVLRAAQMDF